MQSLVHDHAIMPIKNNFIAIAIVKLCYQNANNINIVKKTKVDLKIMVIILIN